MREIELAGRGGEGAETRHRLEGGKRADVWQEAALDVHDLLLSLIDA
ncbi:hypothetical protein [Mesorhizobium sp.]|nr:hypothetical protein [Mesorhizobium sp.]